MPAPIALFAYNRPKHLEKTLAALAQNSLAKQSDLYIFADGAKNNNPQNLEKIQAVRQILTTQKGFKDCFAQVYYQFQDNNLGLANSIITGVNSILAQYESVIVLEDDMICTPDFLSFMNDALVLYHDNPTIFTISGYVFPIKIPENYTKEVFIFQRPSSWGWATWRECWQKSDWEVTDYQYFKLDKNQKKAFNQGGKDLTPMLCKQMQGEIDSWAIRWAYTHFKQGVYCVYPTTSKIQNIGTDKSGAHSPKTSKYKVVLAKKKYHLSQNITENQVISSNFRKFFRPSIIRQIINWWRFNV